MAAAGGNGPELHRILLRGYDWMDGRKEGQAFIAEGSPNETERYKLVAEGASGGLWDWDLIHDMVQMSREWSNLLGFEKPEIASYKDKWRSLIHHEDADRVMNNFHACLDNKQELYQCEYRMKFKNRKYKWISSRGKILWDEQGRAIRMAGSHTDISERKLAERKLERLAYFDRLTGVYLRTTFMDKLKEAIGETRQRRELLAVFFFDVDDFKTINDIYGHEKGDLFLKRMAGKLKACTRNRAVLCRIGGDEFAVFLSKVSDREDIDRLANELLELMKEPVDIQGDRIDSSISIGISVYPLDGCKVKTLINKSDIAMYYAKESGKSCFLYFNDQMMSNRRITYDMKRRIHSSLLNHEFHLCYQPLLDLKTDRVVAAEALVRWRHPEYGLILPADFIPAAEKTRLIIPLGEWILEEACRQLKIWHQRDKKITVSVNVSAIQLHQQGFSEKVSRILRRYQLYPEYLELEMTESIFIGYDQVVDDNLRSLSMLGITLAIDDFGTGYNSFHCIQYNLFDHIKIDKNFIINISSKVNRTIIDTIVYLGHKLNMKVTAEGVEKQEQYEYLREAGCDLAQGYFIGKPLSPDQL